MAYPKLNPFGEAFRLKGYRMPEETEELIKEEPVSLGAPAYKRLWPKAVWPSDILGTVPLSLDTTLSNVTRRTEEEGKQEKISNDFRFPEEVGLLSGGTLGESISFFGEIAFAPEVEAAKSEVTAEIEHAQFNFNGPFGWGHGFNLKMGRFVPELSQLLSHTHLLTAEGPAVMLQFIPIAPGGGSEIGAEDEGAGIALPHSVDGMEAYGILRHRLVYSGGISNGIGPGAESADGNSAKDVFGRLTYKLGGLAPDGEGYVPSGKNWREKSLTVGLFGYRGDGEGIIFPGESPGENIEDRRFNRIGFDTSLFFQDLNLVTGYVRGRDTLAKIIAGQDEGGDGEETFTYDAWFAEAEYVVLPWLHGALRYELLHPADTGAANFKRVVPHVTALIRANVRAYLKYRRDLGESDDYQLLTSLRFAF
jgi:hypothetical protein